MTFIFKYKMSWNHRILAQKQPNGDVYLQIHEVYYDENGLPNGYTKNPVSVGGEDLKAITWTLNKMLEAKKKPVLWDGELFPQEVKIKYQCEWCKRKNFDRPTPHNCNDGFRKRNLEWKILYS